MRSQVIMWFERHGLPGWLAPDYMMMVGLAALLGAAATMWLSERDKANTLVEKRALLATYVGALLGGYVFEWLRVLPDAIMSLSWQPFLHVGRAAYGGLLMGTLCAVVVLRQGGALVRPFLDRSVPLCGLSYGFVRVGCFLAGCDYGKPTASEFGVRFPIGSPAAVDHAGHGWVARGSESLPVHPTQLYEAAIGIFAAGIASIWLAKGKRDGRAFATFISLYAIGRFFVEMLRGDGSRGYYGALSTAQWVSVGLVIAVLVLVWQAKREGRRALAAATALAFLLTVPRSAAAQAQPTAPPTASLAAAAPQTPVPTVPATNIPPPPPAAVAQPYPYPPPAGAQPYPYGPPAPVAQSYPYGPPNGQVLPPSKVEAPVKEEPEEPPADSQKEINKRRLGIGVAFGLYLVPRFGVSNGGTIDFETVWRIPAALRARFELGLGGTFVLASDATLGGVAIPLRFVSGISRRTEMEIGVTPFYSRLSFDSPFFEPVNVLGARLQAGVGWPLGTHFQLGISPIVIGIMGSADVKTLFTYEPKFWMRVAAL
jgi:prolipoprotein diacylglyceryltransferase